MIKLKEFDPRGHYYQLELKDKVLELPSSTTIISKTYPLEYGLKMFFQNKTKEEADELLKRSQLEGSKVHHACHCLLKGKNIDMDGFDDKLLCDVCGLIHYTTIDDYKNRKKQQEMFEYMYQPFNSKENACIKGFMEFVKRFKVKPIIMESIVYDEVVGYAGTMDLLCEMELNMAYALKGVFRAGKDKIISLVDYKTGNYFTEAYNLQLASYYYGTKEMEVKANKAFILKLGKDEEGYPTSGFSLKEVKDLEYNFKKFKLLKQVFDLFINSKVNKKYYSLIN